MITAVVGGQYGSEGKGLIVGHIAPEYSCHVRVGAANAGHTVYTHGGEQKHVMQQLPCAAYANPDAKLVLGAGAMITPEILLREVIENTQWRDRHGYRPLELFVDPRAHVILPEHIEQEQGTDLAERIGSTSTIAREGIGAAQAARVLRTGYCVVGEGGLGEHLHEMVILADTVALLHQANMFDQAILLEGTQGTGLSNVTGQYPYVTSRCTTASGLLADTGLGPADLDQVIMVCRSFPIRVAGNSGPFWPDSREVSWEQLGVDPERERTTVTKKIRRVATLSLDQIRSAARMNSATEIALTFTDYLDPAIAGKSGVMEANGWTEYDNLDVVAQIEATTGVPVTYLGTGPHSVLERETALYETPA